MGPRAEPRCARRDVSWGHGDFVDLLRLALNQGPRAYLGQSLVRIELKVVAQGLARFPDIELADEPLLTRSAMMNSIRRVPVTCTRARRRRRRLDRREALPGVEGLVEIAVYRSKMSRPGLTCEFTESLTRPGGTR